MATENETVVEVSEIKVINPEQLEVIVKKEEDVITIEEGELIKSAYLPYLNDLARIQEAANKLNYINPADSDMQTARRLRLSTVKIRTGAKDLKDERKAIPMRKANLEQAAYNLIDASCKLAEEVFGKVEKAREIAEKKLKEVRKAERIEKLTPYEVDLSFIDLLNMTDDKFELFFASSKMAHEAKLAAAEKEKRDEAERFRLIGVLRERKMKLAPYSQFWKVAYTDNDITVMSEDDFTSLITMLGEAKDEYEAEQEIIRMENEALKNKELEKQKELQLAKEKRTADAIVFLENNGFKDCESGMENKAGDWFMGYDHYSQFDTDKELSDFKERIIKDNKAIQERKEREEKARLEKEIADNKLKAEREKGKKLEAQLKEKEDAEEKRKADEAAAEKKRIADEKKAAKLPDKNKLNSWVDSIKPTTDITGGLKTKEGIDLCDEIIGKFAGFKKWAKSEIEKL